MSNNDRTPTICGVEGSFSFRCVCGEELLASVYDGPAPKPSIEGEQGCDCGRTWRVTLSATVRRR